MHKNEAFSMSERTLGEYNMTHGDLVGNEQSHHFMKFPEILNDVKLIGCLLTTDKAHFHP
jgi:hypothetical protein